MDARDHPISFSLFSAVVIEMAGDFAGVPTLCMSDSGWGAEPLINKGKWDLLVDYVSLWVFGC